MNKKKTKALLFLVMLLTLAACGNKGDLYLPDKQKETTEKEQSN